MASGGLMSICRTSILRNNAFQAIFWNKITTILTSPTSEGVELGVVLFFLFTGFDSEYSVLMYLYVDTYLFIILCLHVCSGGSSVQFGGKGITS